MLSISEAAEKYIGVPFRHQGRTMAGLDCVGLVILAARDVGYNDYVEFAYGREPRQDRLQKTLREHIGEPLDRPPRVNDIVLLRLPHSRAPSHVGIICEHPHGLGIIHAYGEIGMVKKQRFSQSMADRVAGVYEWPAKR